MVITKKNLANGLELSIFDQSRPVAADRWYVKVVCSLAMPVRPETFTGLATGDTELDRLIRERLGKSLEHQLVRERNFVDQSAKNEVVGQLAEQLQKLVRRYLEDKDFPARLFAARYRQIGDTCALEMARNIQVPEEDQEPADFSHCFR